LITGAGGCIGAWIIKQLLDAGEQVAAFDISSDRRRLELLCDDAAEARTVAWEVGNIANADDVLRAVARFEPEAIIHLAALQVPFCKADPVLGAQVNVVGTVNIFEAAKQHNIKRVVYASSVAATAMGTQTSWLETLYGAYKVCNEQTARVYWSENGVSSVGIRPSVVYGPARDQGMSAKPTQAMLAAVAGKPFVIPFTGTVGFVYAAEAASAFIQAATKERSGAAVFDLNGTPQTVADVVKMLISHYPEADIRCEGEPLPFPADMSDRPLRAYIGDYERIDFVDGMTQTLAMFSRRLGENRIDTVFQ
jgi:nucleoside-diphosphate-sugar epimerase